MTPEQFCYWLHGFGELTPLPPTAEQWAMIREHLHNTLSANLCQPKPAFLGAPQVVGRMVDAQAQRALGGISSQVYSAMQGPRPECQAQGLSAELGY